MKKIVTILMGNAEKIAIFSIFAVVLVDTVLLFGIVTHDNKDSRGVIELEIEKQPEIEVVDEEKIDGESKTIRDLNVYEMAQLEYISAIADYQKGFYTDLKEWYLDYKSIFTKYELFIDKPETIYDYYTEKELDLLFRVVQAEVGDEYSFEQKCNVASIILNRIENKEFGDGMFGVLTEDQFTTIANGRYLEVEVSEDTILACEFSFEIDDTTDGCLFFDSDGTLNYDLIDNDGAHNLYRLKEKK